MPAYLTGATIHEDELTYGGSTSDIFQKNVFFDGKKI